MKEVELYVPKVEDLWFRKLCMSDEETMNYNAGYELSFSGYHYETGCIDFPEENWETWHDEKIKTNALFYAYIVDATTREFVGHLNFKKDQDDEKTASMGIVMYSKFRGQGYMKPALLKMFKEAEKQGVKTLVDTVPENREKALKSFFDLGFEKTDEYTGTKFGKEELVYKIEKSI